MKNYVDFNLLTPAKNPRLSITVDRFLYAVLKDEAHRRKISLANVVNQELAEKFATLVKGKEIEEMQKF
jgi:hypothetical protein